jgi:hypothetical protein
LFFLDCLLCGCTDFFVCLAWQKQTQQQKRSLTRARRDESTANTSEKTSKKNVTRALTAVAATIVSVSLQANGVVAFAEGFDLESLYQTNAPVAVEKKIEVVEKKKSKGTEVGLEAPTFSYDDVSKRKSLKLAKPDPTKKSASKPKFEKKSAPAVKAAAPVKKEAPASFALPKLPSLPTKVAAPKAAVVEAPKKADAPKVVKAVEKEMAQAPVAPKPVVAPTPAAPAPVVAATPAPTPVKAAPAPAPAVKKVVEPTNGKNMNVFAAAAVTALIAVKVTESDAKLVIPEPTPKANASSGGSNDKAAADAQKWIDAWKKKSKK